MKLNLKTFATFAAIATVFGMMTLQSSQTIAGPFEKFTKDFTGMTSGSGR